MISKELVGVWVSVGGGGHDGAVGVESMVGHVDVGCVLLHNVM